MQVEASEENPRWMVKGGITLKAELTFKRAFWGM